MKDVLLVDDDEFIVELMEQVLGDMGLSVRQAQQISEAETLLESDDFRLIIVDVTLGNQDGGNLARQLKAAGRNVVLFTAKDDLWIVRNIPFSIPVLKKPFRIADLTDLLTSMNIEFTALPQPIVCK